MLAKFFDKYGNNLNGDGKIIEIRDNEDYIYVMQTIGINIYVLKLKKEHSKERQNAKFN